MVGGEEQRGNSLYLGFSRLLSAQPFKTTNSQYWWDDQVCSQETARFPVPNAHCFECGLVTCNQFLKASLNHNTLVSPPLCHVSRNETPSGLSSRLYDTCSRSEVVQLNINILVKQKWI